MIHFELLLSFSKQQPWLIMPQQCRNSKGTNRLKARFLFFTSAESVLMSSRTGADFLSFFFNDLLCCRTPSSLV